MVTARSKPHDPTAPSRPDSCTEAFKMDGIVLRFTPCFSIQGRSLLIAGQFCRSNNHCSLPAVGVAYRQIKPSAGRLVLLVPSRRTLAASCTDWAMHLVCVVAMCGFINLVVIRGPWSRRSVWLGASSLAGRARSNAVLDEWVRVRDICLCLRHF
jgi:hypothetical protein